MRAAAYAAAACAAAVILVNLAVYLWRWRVLRTLPPHSRPEPLGVAGALAAFLAECGALAACLLLGPWRISRGEVRRTEDASGPSRGAIVLIHDYGLTGGPFWLLRRRLLRQGWAPVVALDHGAFDHDTDRIVARLHARIEQLAGSQPSQIVLVAHGLGGLMARAYAHRYRPPLVRRILTLGTAHRGSVLPAVLGPWARAVAPGSPLLTRVQRDRVPQKIDLIALHSTFDATVLPPASAEYPLAFNIRLNNVGHYGLLFSPKVFVLTEENLEAPLA